VPNWTYALAFHATLVALFAVGLRAREDSEPQPVAAPRSAEPALRPS
jgi:hypothetical protein